MASYSVRLANISDIDALLNIEQLSFRSDRLSRRQFHYLLTQAKAQTWVIMYKGVLSAYCMLLLPELPRSARIYSLGVLPACQGKGMGQHLIKRALREIASRHYKSCVLEVRVGDLSTIRLYENHGFIFKKKLEAYYEDDEDALRMCRTFEKLSPRKKTLA